MNRLVPLIVPVIIGCASTVVVSEVPLPESERRLQVRALAERTVALVRHNREGGSVQPLCSGVWVSPAVFMTAAHCVDPPPSEVLYTTEEWILALEDAVVWPAKAAAKDDIHDLALVLVVGLPPNHAVADVSLDPLWQGDHVQTMGHSVGMWYSYSAGYISAIRRVSFDGRAPIWWIQSDAAISPGNSGCGLWDYRGQLIGSAVGSYAGRAQNVNVFTHRDYILEFLRDHREVLR